jgi:hypothetical protein
VRWGESDGIGVAVCVRQRTLEWSEGGTLIGWVVENSSLIPPLVKWRHSFVALKRTLLQVIYLDFFSLRNDCFVAVQDI